MLKSNDPQTIHTLYKDLASLAICKCMRIIGRRELAEEIVHDVFIRLHQDYREFETKIHAYKWIYKSVHNAAIDAIRSHKHVLRLAAVKPAQPPTNPENTDTDFAHDLSLILSKMSDQDACIFVYYHLDEMTQTITHFQSCKTYLWPIGKD